ncbi:MAG: hypothetical protein M3Z04_22670 [Chloroflexota bacterium]|nr:hypothetical protein [Chloroflexota bacterium]
MLLPLLVPREQFQLRTGLGPAAVWARLTLPGQPFVAGSSGGTAVDFYSDDFDLHKVAPPDGWLAWQPQISGVIVGSGDPSDSGCLIAVRVEPAARMALLCAGWRLVLIAVSILLVVSPQSPYYAFALIVLVTGLLLNNVFVVRFQRHAASAKAYLVEAVRDYPLPEPEPDAAVAPPLASPAPTQRLPRRWVGGTPDAQRYGWGVESPPLPPVAAGAEHETQRLPWRAPSD